MHPIEKLKAELLRLASQGLLRQRGTVTTGTSTTDVELIDVCSNDYLGYGRTSVSRETTSRSGAGASRLIHGTDGAHLELEHELSDWVQLKDSLLFSSGYAANVGLLATLAGPGDLIVSDELNHASIIDGCRLSRARVSIVPHRDLGAIEAALRTADSTTTTWLVTESYFSMD